MRKHHLSLSPLLVLRLLPAMLAVVLITTPLAAQQALNCEVVIREIVADNSGKGLDGQLKDIGKDLKKLTYSTFSLQKTHNHKLEGADVREVVLLGENKLSINSEGEEEGKIRLKIKLTPSDSKSRSFESTLRIPNGGTFIIGGPAYGDGVLILAFTAKK